METINSLQTGENYVTKEEFIRAIAGSLQTLGSPQAALIDFLTESGPAINISSVLSEEFIVSTVDDYTGDIQSDNLGSMANTPVTNVSVKRRTNGKTVGGISAFDCHLISAAIPPKPPQSYSLVQGHLYPFNVLGSAIIDKGSITFDRSVPFLYASSHLSDSVLATINRAFALGIIVIVPSTISVLPAIVPPIMSVLSRSGNPPIPESSPAPGTTLVNPLTNAAFFKRGSSVQHFPWVGMDVAQPGTTNVFPPQSVNIDGKTFVFQIKVKTSNYKGVEIVRNPSSTAFIGLPCQAEGGVIAPLPAPGTPGSDIINGNFTGDVNYWDAATAVNVHTNANKFVISFDQLVFKLVQVSFEIQDIIGDWYQINVTIPVFFDV
jgi:hypothetical protein